MKSIVKLLEPITIGAMELRNRMAMPPMTMCYAAETGGVSQQDIDYFVERAKGGAGLIIIGGVTVDSKLGRLFCPSPLHALDKEDLVAGYSRLVEAVHDQGAKIAIQLYNAGRQTTLERTGGLQPISSSDMETYLMGVLEMPQARAMSIEEIEQLEDAYAEAARRAQTAGFDAVLIDGGAGYGIAQFMSPYVNKRTDQYGGDLKGRMRFPLRIIEKTREKVGPNYTLLFDLAADELIDDGIKLDESRVMARMLEEAGISGFRIHVCLYETYQYVVPPAPVPRGVHVHLAQGIKGALKEAKVMLGHRINDPVLAEEILQKGQADVILLGRPLIADPEFPKKVAEGRLDDIRKCIACNRGCGGRIVLGLPAQCTVNPQVGKEKEYRIVPAEKTKKVIVIGGGVGGMEAARVAALRGHRVTLYDRGVRLGGQALVAALPPNKYEITGLIEYYDTQLKKLQVDVRLGREVTAEDVLKADPDVVIVAAGAEAVLPNIPGVDKKHVVKAVDVLTGRAETGHKVVIVGGGQVGLETADFLAEKGKQITVLEMLPEAGMDVELFTKVFLLGRLGDAGVAVRTGTKVDEITDKGVLSDKEYLKDGWLDEADTVVIAVGMKANNDLYEALKGRAPELYAVGDCLKPRKMIEAIHEGARAARMI